jgi:hypothetical protein
VNAESTCPRCGESTDDLAVHVATRHKNDPEIHVLMRPVVLESGRDAVAFARALAKGDQDGAWEIYRSVTHPMTFAIALGYLLGHVVGDHEELWQHLVDLAETSPRP